MMRDWCRGLLPLFCGGFLLCAWPARAAVVGPEVVESGSVIVTAATAEVRESPSHTSEVITVVEKGEIFLKQGRTRGWYYIKINDDAFGWISGRAISRYRAEGSPAPYVGPAVRYYPYYPGGYYDYSYFYWGQPYLSWEWYFYGRDRHRDSSWDHDHEDHRDRDRDRDRPRDDGWRPDENRPLGEIGRSEGARSPGGTLSGAGERYRANDSRRDNDIGPRSNGGSHSSTPRIRAPFPRR